MTILAAFYSFATTNTAINAEVGTRVYPIKAPTSAIGKKYITYQEIINPSVYHMEAASKLAKPTLQIDCWAPSALQADAISEAVRDSLDGFRGVFGSVDIRNIFFDTQRKDFEYFNDSSQKGSYRNLIEVTIWYFRSVPSLSS